MNDKEQRSHRTVTQTLEKRISDQDVLIIELDKRLMDLTRAVDTDLNRLKKVSEDGFADECEEREKTDDDLRRQLLALQVWQVRMSRTYWQRICEFVRTRWTTMRYSNPLL